MSVLTTGKPNGLTRAAAPARQRAGAVGRGQSAGVSRPSRRRRERPGPGAVRYLRVVPDTGLADGTQTVPENGRRRGAPPMREAGPVRGAPAVREAGPVPGTPTVPGPRRPVDSRRPVDAGQPGAVRRPGDVRRVGNGQGLRPSAEVPDARLAPRRNTVRLTRRGKIVVTVMLTAVSLSLVLLAWLAIAARAAQAADGGESPGAVYQNLTSVVVHPGQTLWSIASQAEPTADPRVVMQQIIDLNALRGTSVEPGQRLWVPRG
jgi:LysM domain